MVDRLLTWTPRVLTMVFIGFISLFALDVFGEFNSWQKTALALFMHLIPSIALVGLLIVAWYKKRIGGVIFVIIGICFGFAFDAFQYLTGFLLLVLPLWIVGILFFISDKKTPPLK
ncbi:MAG: hypothetical protein A2840_01675 [Candidatus Buchananbacteria bacterium RIFCSPHIGHO2_01_FULL_47_11b]|uniref:DUF7670 domain-containing protein n=1 Tax=Candidatus Buchananbacteria bacterium RIFCSPHIGHO2_01_FULL_47_11b TaxID=1797537 RepID=A0A1G1Y4S3_9BACT|nr:MAG: hypothetical protein A2840_01675 [Candidatus Buchananbacteria bacterium RIFCSPHIGHO2_01_FULL_47_11b]